MALTSQQVERKLEQHGNDIVSIYEMLTVIQSKQSEHDARFDGIDGRLDGIDGRLGGIDNRLDGLETQVGQLNEAMTEVLRRLPEPPSDPQSDAQ